MEATDHFKTDFSHTPAAAGRFLCVADIEPVEYVPGLSFQPVIGEQSLANFVRYQPHTVAPRHSHVEEQVVIVLEGELHFQIDDETRVLRPGDIAVVPSWVPHSAWTVDGPCLQVDFFTPPRANLVEHAVAAQAKALAAEPA